MAVKFKKPEFKFFYDPKVELKKNSWIRDIKYEDKGSLYEVNFRFNSPLIEINEGEIIAKICQKIGFNMFVDIHSLFQKLELSVEDFLDYITFYYIHDFEHRYKGTIGVFVETPVYDKKIEIEGKRESEYLPILLYLIQNYYITGYYESGYRDVEVIRYELIDREILGIRNKEICLETRGWASLGLYKTVPVKCNGKVSNKCLDIYEKDGEFYHCQNLNVKFTYDDVKKIEGQPYIKNIYLKLGQGGYNLLSQRKDFYNELQLAPSRKTLERIATFNNYMTDNSLNLTKKIKQPLSHNFFICENNEIYYFKDHEITETTILRELQDFVKADDGSMLDHRKLREKFTFNEICIDTISLENAKAINFDYTTRVLDPIRKRKA